MRSFDDECAVAHMLAERVRANRATLTQRWLERIADGEAREPDGSLPDDAAFGHASQLVDGIADSVDDPARESAVDVPVDAIARELGALRHRQGFSAEKLLAEYEILGGVLFTFVSEQLEQTGWRPTPVELLACAQRLFRAVAAVQRATMTHFLDLARDRVQEREQRLRTFNRSITHELKTRIAAVLGAADLLQTVNSLEAGERARFARMVTRNAREMQATLENLLDLSRLEGDARRQRHVQLAIAVSDVLRRLRETASSGDVQVSVVGLLPHVDVNAAAVELALTNYVSNAVKYADPAKTQRWVHIDAEIRTEDGCDVVVRVSDNGIGVAPDARAHLFEQFFRARDARVARRVEGTGLGLNIVRETIDGMGGRVWAEFPREGSVFAFSIPCRREGDRMTAPAPTERPTAVV